MLPCCKHVGSRRQQKTGLRLKEEGWFQLITKPTPSVFPQTKKNLKKNVITPWLQNKFLVNKLQQRMALESQISKCRNSYFSLRSVPLTIFPTSIHGLMIAWTHQARNLTFLLHSSFSFTLMCERFSAHFTIKVDLSFRLFRGVYDSLPDGFPASSLSSFQSYLFTHLIELFIYLKTTDGSSLPTDQNTTFLV